MQIFKDRLRRVVKLRIVFIIIFVYTICFVSGQVLSATVYEQLITDLLTDYQPLVSPIQNFSDRIQVGVGIGLDKIIDVVSCCFIIKLHLSDFLSIRY